MARERYKCFVDAFVTDIRSGKLQPGTRLPTHRELALREGIALVTATRVYAELEAMGLVAGETGRGTFVKESSLPPGLGIDQLAVAVDMVDLNFNYPSLPHQAGLLRTALRQLATSGDIEAALRYQPHGGRMHERDIVASHLAGQGLSREAGQVMIVNGAQHGLAITVMAILKPGDVVATDSLTYPGFRVLARMFGLELVSLPDGVQGIEPDDLAALCKRRRVKAVYVQPTMHNPMGWVMDLERRKRLVTVVRQYGLLVIEDAAYAFLEKNAPLPLAQLAPESTVYISSLSKSVATGLRVGFVAAPGKWVSEIERAIRVTCWNTPALMTALACKWIENGTVTRFEAEKQADAAKRQIIVSEILNGLDYTSHPVSYFAWLRLPEEVRADKVVKELISNRISVSTAEPFSVSVHIPHAIRLALGSVSLDTLKQALLKVRQVIDGQAY